jgi:hypothetical protein
MWCNVLQCALKCMLQIAAVCVAVGSTVCAAVCLSNLSNGWFSSLVVSYSVLCCRMLQCAAMCFNVPCSMCWSVRQCVLQCVAVCCGVLQCVSTCLTACVAVCGSVFCGVRHSVYCSMNEQSVKWVILLDQSVLQYMVLQCVAMCCNVRCSMCCSAQQCLSTFDTSFVSKCVLQRVYKVCQRSDSRRPYGRVMSDMYVWVMSDMYVWVMSDMCTCHTTQ